MNQADSPDGPTITRLKSIKRPGVCESIPLADALREIQSGTWKRRIEAVRALVQRGDDEGASREKERLPCLLFAGVFRRAEDEGLVSHSGLAVIDIDQLAAEELDRVRRIAAKQPWLVAAFTSPRGQGLKLIARVGVHDQRSHKQVVRALRQHCGELLGVGIDDGDEVSRKCFVSFDPELFQNLEAALWVASTSREDFTEGRRDAGVGGNDVVLFSPPPSLSPKLGESWWLTDPELDAQIERFNLVPERKHRTHGALLGLARLTLTLKEGLGRDLTDAERGSLFDRWYDLARSKDPEFVWRGEGAYWLEFESMVKIARIALGNPVIRRAWELANSEPLPLAATTGRVGKSTCTRMLVALCFQLSRMDPVNGCFFLGCRDAGKCLDLSAQQAATLLAGLSTTGILELVNAGTKGPNGKAARYRWGWAAVRTATTPPGST